MSVKLMTKVWDSALPPDEKFLCLALADFANDNGESVFPSQAYMAWKVGKDTRSVRRTLNKLKNRHVLDALSGVGGGRGVTVHWRIAEEHLPAREPFVNPDINDTKHGRFGHKPGHIEQETRTPTSDDPLDDPLEETPMIHQYQTPRFSYDHRGFQC